MTAYKKDVMRIFFNIVIISLLLTSCNTKNKVKKDYFQKKEIEVSINKNIETFMILRALSNKDPLFKYRKSDYKGKPIMYIVRKYFKGFKNDIAVKETQQLLKKTDGGGSLILQGLLYASELPNAKITYKLNDYWKEKETNLTDYIKTLKDFYIKANVEKFLAEYDFFYKGAISEAKSYLNENQIKAMEDYFGQENKGYKMILIPNSPFEMGFGAEIVIENERILYQILSPANEIEWFENNTNYTEFGYSGKGAKEYYRDMVVHEFCHSFITPVIEQEKHRLNIAKTDSLYIPKLDSIMKPQGYGDWWSFVNEHLVRLGELRVSKTLKTEDFEDMRNVNINVNGFILIPEAEQLVQKYENNRETYPTFDLFIPKLINQLENYTKPDIENKIKLMDNKSVKNKKP